MKIPDKTVTIVVESWFHTNMQKISVAQEQLKYNPNSESDRKIVANGVRSPAYGNQMSNLMLTSNHNVRQMARAYKEKLGSAN